MCKVGDRVRILTVNELLENGYKILNNGSLYNGYEVIVNDEIEYLGKLGTIVGDEINYDVLIDDTGFTLQTIPSTTFKKVEDYSEYDDSMEKLDYLALHEDELSDKELAESGAFDLETSNLDSLVDTMKEFKELIKKCTDQDIKVYFYDNEMVEVCRDNDSVTWKYE